MLTLGLTLFSYIIGRELSSSPGLVCPVFFVKVLHISLILRNSRGRGNLHKKRFLSSHPAQIYQAYRRLSSHVMHSQDLTEIPAAPLDAVRL